MYKSILLYICVESKVSNLTGFDLESDMAAATQFTHAKALQNSTSPWGHVRPLEMEAHSVKKLLENAGKLGKFELQLMKHVDCFCEIERLQTGLYFQSKPVTCNGTVDLQGSLSHQLYVGPGGMPTLSASKLDWDPKMSPKTVLQASKETPFSKL